MFWKYDWEERNFDVSTNRNKYARSFLGKVGSALILEVDIRCVPLLTPSPSPLPRTRAADGEDYILLHKVVSALCKYYSFNYKYITVVFLLSDFDVYTSLTTRTDRIVHLSNQC